MSSRVTQDMCCPSEDSAIVNSEFTSTFGEFQDLGPLVRFRGTPLATVRDWIECASQASAAA
jgi:hypothetical protein